MADVTDETDLAVLSEVATQLWLRSQSPACPGGERAAFAGQAELLQAKLEQLVRARLDSGGAAFAPVVEKLDRAVGKLQGELQGLVRLVEIANAVRYVASAADELLQLAAKAIP
jgi:hypothetical protein